MPKRTTAAIAVVSGALALTAVAIPAAQASGNTPAQQGWQLAQQFRAEHPAGSSAQTFSANTAQTATAEPYPLAVTFSNVKVNNGKPAVNVGTAGIVHVPYTYTLTATDVDVTADDFFTGVDLYHGSATDPDGDLWGDEDPTCTITSTTSSTDSVVTVESCKGTVDIYADTDLVTSQAGNTWHTVAWAVAYNGQDPWDPDASKIGTAELTGLPAPSILRAARLSTNATPEPVKKNGTLTITGALTRADWNTLKYTGYANVPVKLQFRKPSTGVFTTVKTIKTDSKGNLKTTAKATGSGFWRYSFAGTATTPALNATEDGVSIK
jgi:hypothetical protein